MYNVGISGGAGMVGSHLVDRLIAEGHNVSVIDDLSTGRRENINPKANFYFYDVSSPLVSEVFEEQKFDYFFHLAAQINLRKSVEDPIQDANSNIIGTINIAKLCSTYKVKKLIFMSSGGAVYSESKNPSVKLNAWDENAIVDPESPYGLGKLTAENYIKLFSKHQGLSFAILRPSNIYGPRQNALSEAGVISLFINNILHGKDLFINSDGEQTRDFIDVFSVVDACVHVMKEDPKLNDIFNVSTGIETNINYLAKTIINLMWANTNIKYKEKISSEMLYCRLDSNKLHNFGWKPRFSLDDGLKQTIKWFCDNHTK